MVLSKIKNKKVSKKVFFLLLWPLGFILFWSTARYPQYVETFYAGISKNITGYLSLLTGILPFSLAETLVILMIISLFVLFVSTMMLEIIRGRKGRQLGSFLFNLIIILGVIYFVFVIIWGLNYNRQPFAEIAGLKVEAASSQELAELCEKLIDRANTLRQGLTEDEDGVMIIEGGFSQVRREAEMGFNKASLIYPELGGRFGWAKPVFFSEEMSYTGISGIYFPFTGEANVNIDIPHSLLPAITCHEMAHQRGFAREDEANYIAWITASANDNPQFQNSGTLLALIHTINALFSSNPERGMELSQRYDAAVVRDLQHLSEYWKKHEGKVEEIASDVNDAYLKGNRQEDGVRSYGRMVDLLLAEQNAEPTQRFLD